MQVAAGMQGHGGVFGAYGYIRHHVLQTMGDGQAVVLAQGLARSDQGRVVFQAGQLLACVQQAAAKVAFAGAPVQPMPGCLRKLQRRAEGFDLLPFAAGHIDIQAVRGGLQGLRSVTSPQC